MSPTSRYRSVFLATWVFVFAPTFASLRGGKRSSFDYLTLSYFACLPAPREFGLALPSSPVCFPSLYHMPCKMWSQYSIQKYALYLLLIRPLVILQQKNLPKISINEETSSTPTTFWAEQVNSPVSFTSAIWMVKDPVLSITYRPLSITPFFFHVIFGRGKPSVGQVNVSFVPVSSVIRLPTGVINGCPSPMDTTGGGWRTKILGFSKSTE